MGVNRKSETLLEFDDTFVFVAAWGISLLFIVAGTYFVLSNQLFGVIFVLTGGLVAVIVKRNKVTLDKSTSKMTASVFSVLGPKKFDCDLSQISKVSFVQIEGGSSGPQSTLRLVLADGTIMTYPNMVSNVLEAQQVASFLGVPFESQGPMNMAKAADLVKQNVQYYQQWGADQKKMQEKFKGA